MHFSRERLVSLFVKKSNYFSDWKLKSALLICAEVGIVEMCLNSHGAVTVSNGEGTKIRVKQKSSFSNFFS